MTTFGLGGPGTWAIAWDARRNSGIAAVKPILCMIVSLQVFGGDTRRALIRLFRGTIVADLTRHADGFQLASHCGLVRTTAPCMISG